MSTELPATTAVAGDQHIWNVVDVDIGRAGGQVFADLEIDGGLSTGVGLAGPGLAVLVADSVLGSMAADHADGAMIATATLTMNFLRRPTESGSLRGVAESVGRRHGAFLFTSGSILDGTGTEIAKSGAWFAVREERLDPSRGQVRRTTRGRAPEPHCEIDAAAAWADPCATPLGRTMGITGFARPTPDTATLVLPRIGQWCNASGALHGGAGALLASMAALGTLGGRPPAEWDVLSLTCEYLRAGSDRAGPVRALGSRVRRGRSSAVVQGEIHTADGRVALRTALTVAVSDDRAPAATPHP